MRRRGVQVLAILVLAACGGGGDGSGGPMPCPEGPFLVLSPVALADIDRIVPLGNLNPPGHTFPTGHMYFYLRVPPGTLAPVVTDLFAPGDLTVVGASATEHVTAGFTDYGLTLAPCAEITIELGHVSSLAPALFGDVSSLDGWTFEGEYATGGETYRRFSRAYDLPVAAGDVLGTTGGRSGQWALDVGAYDAGYVASDVANPARWSGSRYLHAVCVLDLYAAGAASDPLWALVDRAGGPGDAHPCGQVLQDVPGTAQGCWFAPGAPGPHPEDPHLALVWSNTEPERPAFSVGTSVPGVTPGRYLLDPLPTGRWNRPFAAVTPDGQIYGYQPTTGPGILLVQLPDAETLWIELSATATPDPTTWSFTASRAKFER